MAQRQLTFVDAIWFQPVPNQNVVSLRFEAVKNANNNAIMADLFVSGTDGGWIGETREIAWITSGNKFDAIGISLGMAKDATGTEVWKIAILTPDPTSASDWDLLRDIGEAVMNLTNGSLWVEDKIP